MESFRHACLDIAWPLCILLWTLMAVVSLWESIYKYHHRVKALTKRLDVLERKAKSKQISGKVTDTHVFTDTKGQQKLRITFESGSIYEIAYDSD